MVMNRRHTENPLAAQLKRANLQNDRERFDHKNAADEKQQDFLLDDDGDDPKGSAERQRADIAHEDFSGMSVVPEKTERSANQRAAKDRQFADARNVLNVEVSRPARVAADVSEYGQGARGDDSAANRQTVEAVSQIHRVGRAGDNDGDEQQERYECQSPEMPTRHQRMDYQIGMKFFQERNDQLCGIRTVGRKFEQADSDHHADQHLQQKFSFAGQTEILFFRDLGVVVDEADHRKSDQGEQRHQDESVGEIGPEKNW